jgi:prepilin-type N-terminal cleavage/methylation domain-containing protein
MSLDLPGKNKGFTLVELVIAMAITAILAGVLIFKINPPQLIENSRTTATKVSLEEIAKAAKIIAADKGYYPADVNRNIPTEIIQHLSPGAWPNGPFPGSVYDWDNWDNQTCWDGSTHIIQVTLRQINDYQRKTNYVMYYVIKGLGIPHCSTSSDRGICLNCPSRYP